MRSIFAPAKQNNTDVFKGKATFLKALRNKFKKVFKKLLETKKVVCLQPLKKALLFEANVHKKYELS